VGEDVTLIFRGLQRMAFGNDWWSDGIWFVVDLSFSPKVVG